MSQDAKIGITLVGFSVFLYYFLIPMGIDEPGVEWKGGLGVLKNIALSPRLFPFILAIVIAVLGGLLVLTDFLRKRKLVGPVSAPRLNIRMETCVTMGILVLSYSLLYIIGYLFATIVTLGMLLYCFGMRKWTKIVPVAVIGPLIIYLVLEKLMLVQLPKGVFPTFP